VRITEELLERKVAAAVKKIEITDRKDKLTSSRDTLLPTKAGTKFAGRGCPLVGMVRLLTKATDIPSIECGECEDALKIARSLRGTRLSSLELLPPPLLLLLLLQTVDIKGEAV
jgi:hypothetical protein